MSHAPLTLGTAGHIDHGKTALVRALTGVDTDTLPEERTRGMTIALGYAPLALPSGRVLSVVDVPGHERFVRTMVAGATGVDLFLMVVAADDGVMPQTREHAAVLRGLGVGSGVVAVSKADVADPVRAAAEARELLPGVAVVRCSARTGDGLDAVRLALDDAAATLPGRAPSDGGAAALHVDRAFVIDGRGCVVTGTLWRGALRVGDRVLLQPGARRARVRGLQVHDAPVERATAGQRVAVNLAGVRLPDVRRGDALTTDAELAARSVLDCALMLREDARHGEQVHVHHGTRAVPGRLVLLEDELWQLRLERPVIARDGERVVVRRSSPADTLGGGTILDAAARRHGRRPDLLAALRARRDGECPAPAPPPRLGAPPSAAILPLSFAALALEQQLLEAGAAFPSEGSLDAAALRELRAAGRAVRVSGRCYGHPATVRLLSDEVLALIARTGSASLAEVRDALGLSRKSTQALLEHLDAGRATRRGADDRRTLARGAAA